MSNMNTSCSKLAITLRSSVAIAVLLPVLAAGSPAAQLATNPPAPDQILVQLRSRLAEAQGELDALLAAQTGGTNSLPEATPAEAIEYHLVLQASVRAYQRQIDDIASLEVLNERQRDLAQTIRSWTGFAEPPPYSILLIDNLRDSIQSLTTGIETIQANRDIFEKLGTEARDLLSQSDRRLRLLNEEIEAATEPAQRAKLTWQRTLESARNHLGAANSAVFERRRQRAVAELTEQRQRLEFARRQLVSASRQVRFSQADLDKVLAGLDANRRQLEAEKQAAELSNQKAQEALRATREELRLALAEPPRPGTNDVSLTARVSTLQRRIGVRTIQAETASQRLNLSRQLIDLATYERAMWQARYTTFGSTDAATLQQAYRRLVNLQRILQTVKPYFVHQLDLAARQIAEEQESVQNSPEAERDPVLGRERLDSFTERETFYRGALRSVEKNARLLLRWKESLDQDRLALPLTGRIRDLFSEFSTFATKLWNFEVFVAEDTITVDGQPITGRRSVTIGKIAKAILILVIGYWLANLFARLLERLAVRRIKIEPNQANLIRRWTRVVLVLLLILLSLVWVKIPFTVFAFLGGALAIAFGFGMQTLLKNFISGIIILFERPFRVGDVLETGGQRGKVTSIGIRSSVLQIADGTEALIPNSMLLESSLTNWTYSNRFVRSSINMVVASDSDTREVARLLTEAVDRHGLVLKEPKPSVLFKDFGDNGYLFDLRYWLDVSKHSSSQIASDLRHMIATAFTEHGIDLSFPQRELHFDSKHQLRVEVVPPSDTKPDHRPF